MRNDIAIIISLQRTTMEYIASVNATGRATLKSKLVLFSLYLSIFPYSSFAGHVHGFNLD
jgi:hypothetical protein